MAQRHRNNNFDLLRIIAACLVFYSHSLAIYGLQEPALLSFNEVGREITFATLGVSMFFVISGYLVTASWDRTRNFGTYLASRALRIYPGLLANALFTYFVLLPLLIDSTEYFGTVAEQLHLIAISVFLGFRTIDFSDVFANNFIPNTINGALWTLRYEVACYLVLLGLGITVGVNRTVIAVGVILFILYFHELLLFPQTVPDLAVMHCVTFFIGSLFYLCWNSIALTGRKALFCLCLLAALSYFDIYYIPLYLLPVCYITIYIALGVRPLGHFAKYGDFSYGMYIYAWPIQQTFGELYKFEPENYLYFAISSFFVTLCLAIISWHFVEAPALKLKHLASKNKG